VNPLTGVFWKEKSKTVDKLLQQSATVVATPLPSGLEAEVVKIDLGEISCVMKVWNRSSKPNVGCQVQMLKEMYNRGLPVSRPLGWGMDEEGHSVLLTPYDGSPIKTANRTVFARIADINGYSQAPNGGWGRGDFPQSPLHQLLFSENKRSSGSSRFVSPTRRSK
jgi:hypothetical protein